MANLTEKLNNDLEFPQFKLFRSLFKQNSFEIKKNDMIIDYHKKKTLAFLFFKFNGNDDNRQFKRFKKFNHLETWNTKGDMIDRMFQTDVMILKPFIIKLYYQIMISCQATQDQRTRSILTIKLFEDEDIKNSDYYLLVTIFNCFYQFSTILKINN